MTDSDIKAKLTLVRARLVELDVEKQQLQREMAVLKAGLATDRTPTKAPFSFDNAPVTNASSSHEKVKLFRRLFAGRPDVFPLRWENRKTGRSGYSPACANEWVQSICGKPKIKCSDCSYQKFNPPDENVIERHLRGDNGRGRGFVAGVYPLLSDDTCWFLAADFDKASWSEDTRALLQTCYAKGVPASLERSRSGNGGHIWIFFSEPISARLARQLGSVLITETMEKRPEIGFSSYDRLFPNQDTIPRGGFGNLIALPLQKAAREVGNSVFIDKEMQPYNDQWAYLSSQSRMSTAAVTSIVETAEHSGRVLNVRVPIRDEQAEKPWKQPPSRCSRPRHLGVSFSHTIKVTVADQVYVDRSELPSAMVTQLVRLAAFQNPEFYRAQAMRLPTFDKPRVVSCAELHSKHIALPRGCFDEMIEFLTDHGATVYMDDLREDGAPLPVSVRFSGNLLQQQSRAFDALIKYDTGVLAATTAFGKTVVASALIAHRARNTLILVHRRELLNQWINCLESFLQIDPKKIGKIGGGQRRPSGIVDVALIQSLNRKGEVDNIVANYGHLVVDECHHLSATSFERVARRSKARYVTGLSATVARKDGWHPIIFMQCGPVRHQVNAKSQAAESGLRHRARERHTKFRLPKALAKLERPSMPAIYAALAEDRARNDLIFDDVLKSLEARRSPIVLTERKDHLEYLRQRFSRFAKNIVVLCGGLSAIERKVVAATLNVADGEERLILATGRYIGEGFDDARLDTLFLTMPIAWKGTLAQYVGRLHRRHDGKSDVLVIDYVDSSVPVLGRMATKRRAGYRGLGYVME
ncbi:MAG: DEAD/DEAH box helicase family protein [Aestuariivita sp.]|nr:DEAD/DEAH box helicase family protein [Aestuariivita sp.]